MNRKAEVAESGGGLNPELLLPLLLAIGVGALAVSSQSFWMDESATAITASQPNFSTWCRAMALNTGSDQQMPLYMLFAWLWEKFWSYGEWALRAANLPWLALALAALPRRPTQLLPVVLISPFLWFYLNEARPYALQICAGLLLLGALARLADNSNEKTGYRWFATGIVLLAGSSLIGMIWAGAFLISALIFLHPEKCRRLVVENRLTTAAATIFLSALAVYYWWTLMHVSNVTAGETGIGNLAFAGYELLGFAGLGPGRAEIRTAGLASFLPFWPQLMVAVAVTTVVLLAGLKAGFQSVPRRVWLGVAVAFGAATVFLFVAGELKHFRVLGRHFAPLAPLLLLLLAAGLNELRQRGRVGRAVVVIFISSSLASAFSLRFAERHAKDDYRSAAAVAHAAAAQHLRVWWCADINAGLYYGLPVAPELAATTNQIWLALNASANALARQPVPDVVVLSRPEINDPLGAVRDWLAQNHFHVAASPHLFTVWRAVETNSQSRIKPIQP